MRALPLALVLALALGSLALVRADDKDFYLDGVEKVEVKQPPLRVVRPNRDWVFLNLEALAKSGRAGDARLKARLLQGGANANFYVLAWPDEREDASSEKIGQALEEETRGFFKDKGRLVAAGATKHHKLDAFGFEVEGALVSGGDDLSVSKLVVYRPGDKQVFVMSLEVPKKNAGLVKKDKAKLFSGVQLQ